LKTQSFLSMKNNSIQQQHIRNAVLLSAIVLLSLISTVAIEKVQAVTSFSSVYQVVIIIITKQPVIIATQQEV